MRDLSQQRVMRARLTIARAILVLDGCAPRATLARRRRCVEDERALAVLICVGFLGVPAGVFDERVNAHLECLSLGSRM